MVVVTVRVSTTAVAVPLILAYAGEGHNKECYCGSTSRDSGRVIRDAYTGSRSANSSGSNAGSGIIGGEGLTMVFDRVTGNI